MRFPTRFPTRLAAVLTGAVVTVALLGACTSDSSDETTAAAPTEAATTVAAAPDTTAGGLVPDTAASETPTDDTLADVVAAVASAADADDHEDVTHGISPCNFLTSEEVAQVLGVTIESKDDASGGCSYFDTDDNAVLLMTTGSATDGKSVMGLARVTPNESWVDVPGVGDEAIAAGPPTGRGMVIAGDLFIDVSKALSSEAVSEEQIVALLKAAVESL